MLSIGCLSQSVARGFAGISCLTRGRGFQMATPMGKANFQTAKRVRVEAGGSNGADPPTPEGAIKTASLSRKSRKLTTQAKISDAFELHPLPGFEPPPARVIQQQTTPDIDPESRSQEEEPAEQQGGEELSKEQKMRMELNKAIAQKKRILRLCEERIAESQKQGKVFPDFQDLLVEKTWLDVVKDEFTKPYMTKLHTFIEQEVAGQLPIYPPPALLFNAFHSCPFDKVKVVIIGQDPYHGPGQAMGMCFSVPQGVKIPSSLQNMFKEIASDVGTTMPSHGNLEKWANQGVLMINAVFTVREHHANSHAKKGWEPFTDVAIRAVSKHHKGVVFLLWGNSAQEKTRLIDTKVHHILKAAHPSGLSANRGFFKCKHFSKANEILEKAGKLPIDWQL